MFRIRSLVTVLLLVTLSGCRLNQLMVWPERRSADPVLPPTIESAELVAWLNSRTEGLESWRSTDVKVHVRMPGLPMPQKLSGSLACSAPRSFRLVAQNLVGLADFGSNDDLCWAYAKPGESIVLTWQHEDAGLLSMLPGGLPHLDSDWLMTILGVAPLDPASWQLEQSGQRTVRLVSMETDSEGRNLERSILVDLVKGEAREHVLRDGYGNVQVMAQLSDYRPQGGVDLPHIIRVNFPATDTELTISIGKVSVNGPQEARLWEPPRGEGLQQLDVREVLAQLERGGGPQFQEQSETIQSEARANAALRQIAEQRELSDEPVFDSPAAPPRRFRWFPFRK
ncbi:MAG: hypothetical protein ACK5X8_02395 [Planctomyces sp.]